MSAEAIGEYKVQIDRWPITDDEDCTHVVTVIVMKAYKGKPDSHQIGRVLVKAGRDLLAAEVG